MPMRMRMCTGRCPHRAVRVPTAADSTADAMEKNLSLPAHYLEPSRLSLWRYGNTSSASIWYELEIISELGNSCGAEREGGALPAASTAAADVARATALKCRRRPFALERTEPMLQYDRLVLKL